MKPTRLALLAAAGVLITTSPLTAHATPAKQSPPQVSDTCGDKTQETAQPGWDIKSFRLSTTGTTTTRTVKKKKVTTYKPNALIAVLTLCGPVVTTPGSTYIAQTDTSGCDGGYLEYSYRADAQSLPSGLYNGDLYVSGCGANTAGAGASEFLTDVQAQVAGSTITWTMALAELGSDLPIGSTFTNFEVRTGIDDPIIGEIGTWFVGSVTSGAAGDIDYVHSGAVWKLG